MNASLRMPDGVADRLLEHLSRGRGEHFGFLLCRTSISGGEPLFLAHDVITVPDDHVRISSGGWELDDRALDDVINAAVRTNSSLVEAHNHSGTMPRFSATDQAGLEPFARYVCESLPGRPYGATVWAGASAWGEWFALDGDGGLHTGQMRAIASVGAGHLHTMASHGDDAAPVEERYDRQLSWFTAAGQRMLQHLRVGVIGVGGTGSQVILALAYLGIIDYVLIDPDDIDITNLNRVLTATLADISTPKVIVGRRAIRTINPAAQVDAFETALHDADALDALKACDLIFGCVDNDGPRLALNAIALAYGIPLVDIGTGIFVDTETEQVDNIGGRIATVVHGGPCLSCMDEIDTAEARHYFAAEDEQRQAEALGYVTGADEPTPAVVSLNGIAANLAVTEAATMVVGPRAATSLVDLDVLGQARPLPGTWATPRRVSRREGCFECATEWRGDEADVGRFVPASAAVKNSDRRGPATSEHVVFGEPTLERRPS